ncbi:MAG: cupin domain-containing protein [Candidatus Acidiferrales bacterium]|jgi:quercetin dioxygenase-like cupin family protein
MSRTEPIIVGPGQTRHADGRSLVVPDELQCKVRTSDLGGRLCIMLADHAPWEGPPLHTHRDGDEWFYVIKGEFVYEVGGKLHRVVEGGSLVAPQKIPHRYINGPLPGTLFVGLTPGGGLEEFFEEGARRRRNPSPSPPTREEMITFYAKFNVDYLGGKLTEEDFKKATT